VVRPLVLEKQRAVSDHWLIFGKASGDTFLTLITADRGPVLRVLVTRDRFMNHVVSHSLKRDGLLDKRLGCVQFIRGTTCHLAPLLGNIKSFLFC